MKSFLVLAAFAVVIAAVSGAAPTPKELVAAASKKCATEHKLSEDKVKFLGTREIPRDETERCFLECVYGAVGVVKDGKFSYDGGVRLADARFKDPTEHTKAVQMIKTCSEEIKPTSDKCWAGKEVRECFVKHSKEANFFPSHN